MRMLALKIYPVVALLMCCEQAVTEDEVENLNSMVDTLIESTVMFIKAARYELIPIPDLERRFNVKIIGIPVTGGMKAVGGVFQNLSTLKRTGDATRTQSGNEKRLRILLGLETMEVHFDHCRLWFGKLSISESLWVKVGKNSVDIEVSIVKDGNTCTAKLDHIKINELRDFDVTVKGLGKLDKMMANIERWVIDHFENVISTMVEEKLTEQATKALEKYDICQFL